MATKVLVVDDNGDTRFSTARILKHLGCEVTEFPDAYTALKLLVFHNPFDVIFVDVFMPGMNGLQLVEIIRVRYPDARVVLISSGPWATAHPEIEQMQAAACILGDHSREKYRAVLQDLKLIS